MAQAGPPCAYQAHGDALLGTPLADHRLTLVDCRHVISFVSFVRTLGIGDRCAVHGRKGAGRWGAAQTDEVRRMERKPSVQGTNRVEEVVP